MKLLKIFLSLGMLGLVLKTVDFEKLKSTVADMPLGILVLVFLLYLLGQFLSSFKWWYIAKSGGIDVSFKSALKSYFIGMFVNCFGFGVVGGDVARGLLLSHGKPQKTPAIASVVADRLHGLVVLSLLCIVSLYFVENDNLSPALKSLIMFIIFAVIVGWFCGPYILLKLIKPENKYRRKAEQLCHVFPNNPKVLFIITLVSLVFHLLQIGLHYILGIGFGVVISWSILLTRIPIVNILTTLPISWNGLGVREKGYSYFLTPEVLTQEQAVAFGAVWLIIMTAASALGGIISIITKDFAVISDIEKSEDYAALEKENAQI